MKIFKSTGVTGKAGELYFAYWIVRNFQWPCRILDIDVGIDAQVEVFEDEISTGDFFAVQIKSTIGHTPDIQISLVDFEYWQQMENNVILVSVVFSGNYNEPDIYWKHFPHDEINKIISNAEEKQFSSKLITFSPTDKLEPDSKAAWVDSLLSESDRELIRIAKSLIADMEAYDFDNFVKENYHEQDQHKDVITFSSNIDHINGMFIDYETLKDAASYDRRLRIRAVLIDEAIDIFWKNENSLLFMFNHAFHGIKEGMMPDQLLPHTLSREIRSQTENWVSGFTGN